MQFAAHQHVQSLVALDPDAYASGTVTTAGSTEIDTLGFEEAIFTLMVGDIGTSGSITIQIQESSTSGSGYADVSGAVTTALTQAGTDSNKHAIISLDLRKRARYLIVELDVDDASCDAAVHCLLFSAQVLPVVTTGSDEVVRV